MEMELEHVVGENKKVLMDLFGNLKNNNYIKII
jgi:hypothetical protein